MVKRVFVSVSRFLDTLGPEQQKSKASPGLNIPESYSGAQIPSAGTSVVTNTGKRGSTGEEEDAFLWDKKKANRRECSAGRRWSPE